MALGQRLGEEHRDVVGEDDADPDDEAAQLAVAATDMPSASAMTAKTRQATGIENFCVDRHDLVVRRLAFAPACPRCPSRSCAMVFSVRPRGRSSGGNTEFGIERDHELLGEAVRARLARLAGRVAGAVGQHQVDRPVRPGRARCGRARPGRASMASGWLVSATSRSFQPVPPGSASLAGIQRPVRELLEEHAAAGYRSRPSWS